MANSINATSTGNGGIVTTGDDSGVLNIQTNETTALSIDASQNLTFTNGVNAPNTFGFKNRIINGAMTINQRATSVTASGYVTDRFEYAASVASKATVSQDTSVYPTGFNASLKVLSSSAYTVGAGELFVVKQAIEGFNFADMGWGTASAQPITISFWVRSSLTGTFGGALQNSAQNRSYPFTYAISAANTWEQKTVTIAGDTSGTWVGATNGVGVYVFLGLGAGSSVSGTANTWAGAAYWSATGAVSVVGTNAATWYVTGVQLEKGTQATSFDFRSYGTELSLCHRYYQQWDYTAALGGAGATAFAATKFSTTDTIVANAGTNGPMRTSPTITSSNASVRAIFNTGQTSATLSALTIASGGAGTLMITAANNGLGAGFGWLDQIGTVKASAEL